MLSVTLVVVLLWHDKNVCSEKGDCGSNLHNNSDKQYSDTDNDKGESIDKVAEQRPEPVVMCEVKISVFWCTSSINAPTLLTFEEL